MIDDACLLYECREGIATLTLNTPHNRNSLSLAMLSALHDAFSEMGRNDAVRVVILGGAGPVFSAGHDLQEFRTHAGDRDRLGAVFSAGGQLMEDMIRLPKPVIARVQGAAVAAGCQLVAAADLAIAAEEACFSTPGINVGLFCSTPMVPLTRAIPQKHALHMLMTGEAIDARTALRLGLVNEVVGADDLIERTRQLALTLASKSPLALALGKQAFYRQMDMPLQEAYGYAQTDVTDAIMTDDAREGIEAFFAKRAPVWKGA